MSSIVPSKAADRIIWYANHTTPWAANSTAIGTTAAAVTDLETKADAAQAALEAQKAAQDNAKTMTDALHQAVQAMSQAGSDIIKSIKTKAATDGNNVYVLAQIPSPATPTPMPPPGTPYDFKVTLQQDGSLVLQWKCNNPAGSTGTIYQVYRRAATASEFAFIGASGSRKFIDDTLPAGTTGVTYQIIAVRSTSEGAPRSSPSTSASAGQDR